MTEQPPLIHALMMPDYRRDNPYQALLVEAIEANNVKVAFPYGNRRGLPILRAILDQPQPIDVLHLHWLEWYLKGNSPIVKYFYALKLLVDILLVRFVGIRIVWSVHNLVEHDTKFLRLELWLQSILVRIVDHVILLNHSTLEGIIEQYYCSRAKVSVIPHGHYRPFYSKTVTQADARNALKLPPQARIYLNLGMLRPYKGIEDLLQAWQRKQTDLADCILIIAGYASDIAYQRQLEALIAQTQNVVFYPQFVEDEKVPLFFNAADVVVLPYRKILNSGSAILAMSFGKPLIAPQMGSLPEILQDAGQLLYDPNDSQGLSHALQKSFHCDLTLLSQLTVQACDRLDWQPIGQKTAQVYRQSGN